MKKMKLNIQLFGGSVVIQTITETTDIDTNQSTFTIPAKMTTTGETHNYSNASMTMQWRYEGADSWTSLNKQTFSINKSSKVTKSWTLSLTHNDDGSLSNVQFRVSWYITDSTKGTTGATTFTPTYIPRKSDIQSITSGTTDYAPALKWTPASASFKYIIRYLYGSWTYQTGWITPNSTAQQTFNSYTITGSSIAPYMTSSTTAQVLASLYTYTSDGHLVGDSNVYFNVTLNSNINPSVSFTNVSEAGDVPSSWQVNGQHIFVKSKSRVALAISGSGIYGSSISNYRISYYGGAVTTASATTSYLTQTGSTTFTGQVTDTRGRSASTTTTINVVDYSNPTISTAQVQRCDANGNIDNNGEYMYISYGASISPCSNQNTPSAVYKVGYRVHNTGSYQYVPLTTNANSYSASGMLFSDGIKASTASGTKVQFSTSNTYDIQFYVKDYFVEYTNLQLLDAGFDLMNFNPSGKAMAIGKVSEAGANEEKLEVGIPSHFLDRIDVDGYIQQWNPNGRVGSGIIVRGNAQYPEASINYGNVNGNQAYIAGWGTAGIDGWNIWSAESGQNMVEVDKYGSLNINGTYGHQARVRAKRNDTGADIEFGVGSGGVNRGIWDNGKNKWLFYTDNVSTFISPASGDYVFISNGSYWSYLTKKFIRARQTTSQAPDSNGQLNVLFQAVDINTASSALELKTDGKVTIISNDVHHVKVDCTMWVERGSTSYAWCHLWVGGTDICSYMIPNRNNGEVWQSVHFGGIASVSYGMQITPNIYFNVSDSVNGVKGGTYSGSVVIDVEVLD